MINMQEENNEKLFKQKDFDKFLKDPEEYEKDLKQSGNSVMLFGIPALAASFFALGLVTPTAVNPILDNFALIVFFVLSSSAMMFNVAKKDLELDFMKGELANLEYMKENLTNKNYDRTFTELFNKHSTTDEEKDTENVDEEDTDTVDEFEEKFLTNEMSESAGEKLLNKEHE